MNQAVKVETGKGPIILSQPHGGTYVPEDVYASLNLVGRELADTDWHITRLYEDLCKDVTVVKALFHRYVIDANRDPQDHSLYPGQNTTSLCPLTDFDGRDIYQSGQQPNEAEIELRLKKWHQPYHAALTKEIQRVKNTHGFAILYDCHSIRSTIPFLFDGLLPVFSIGTNSGVTCATEIEAATVKVCESAPKYDTVVNGRFKGGWTTRYYGKPDSDVHAIQMELAQRSYMNEFAPWEYRTDLAQSIREQLSKIFTELSTIAETGFNPTGD